MKTLALDASQLQAALCAVEDGRVVAEGSGSVAVSHSEALLAHVHELLTRCGWALGEVDAFAAGVGPGSFTGIRIGCATIKGLAQALGKPVIAFSSLRALALSVPGVDGARVVALVNAYQGQVFAGWTDANGLWREEALTAALWRQTHAHDGHTVLCGTGAAQYLSDLVPNLTVEVSPVLYVSPIGVARALAEGRPTSYTLLAANYLRPSQAEAKLSSLAK